MKIVTIIFSVFLIIGCNTNNRNDYLAVAQVDEYSEIDLIQEHPGKELMENNCYMCHNPKATQEDMIAPPMIAVKTHYILEETSKEDFVNDMVEWSKDPSKEKSKMPGAIKKFGLMPYQFHPESSIRHIADYIFESKIEEPGWFQEHYNKMHEASPMTKDKMQKEN